MGGQWYRRDQGWDWGGGARGWSGSGQDYYHGKKAAGKPYLVCKECSCWCFEWRAKRNAYKCICGEDFELPMAKAAVAKPTASGSSAGADKDKECPEENEGAPTVTFAMLEYFHKVIGAIKAGGGSTEAELHASALAWVESAARKARQMESEQQRSPSLQEALKEEKKATTARAVLARRVEQHTNKIKELERLLAAERDSLGKAQAEEEGAQAQLEVARGRVHKAQEAIRTIEDEVLQSEAVKMDLDMQEGKATAELTKLQEQIDQASRAHQMLVDEVEKRKAAIQKDVEGIATKRTRYSAAQQAKADAAKAAAEATKATEGAAEAAAAGAQQRGEPSEAGQQQEAQEKGHFSPGKSQG